MYLKSLKSVEKLNENELKFIKGGMSASSSRRQDSTSQDSKKHDSYQQPVDDRIHP